jgi:hypothetical protein
MILLCFREIGRSCICLYWPIAIHCLMIPFSILWPTISHTFSCLLPSIKLILWYSIYLSRKCFNQSSTLSMFKLAFFNLFPLFKVLVKPKLILRLPFRFLVCPRRLSAEFLPTFFPLFRSSSCLCDDINQFLISCSCQIDLMHLE